MLRIAVKCVNNNTTIIMIIFTTTTTTNAVKMINKVSFINPHVHFY